MKAIVSPVHNLIFFFLTSEIKSIFNSVNKKSKRFEIKAN